MVKASSSFDVPAPPLPPPELPIRETVDEKEKKAVNIYMFFWWNTSFINLRSSELTAGSDWF